MYWNNVPEKSFISLASERSLDSMNICGIRAKPSRGELGQIREYVASNKDPIRLFRPKIDGEYEEITQTELDILRAINTKYLRELTKLTFNKTDPKELLEEARSERALKVVDNKMLAKLIDENQDISLSITPEEIRVWLKKSKDRIKTVDITKGLQKLSELEVDGIYRVRNINQKVESVRVEGRLINLYIEKGPNKSLRYYIFFVTTWGKLYIHNLRFGNIIWTPAAYNDLSIGAKNILMAMLVFKNNDSFRKTDELLEFLNIKVGNNPKRAKETFEKFLTELVKNGLITWRKDKGVYFITRVVDPTRFNTEPFDDDNNSTLEYENIPDGYDKMLVSP